MASPAPAAPAPEGEGVEVTSAAVSEGFAELERQQQLIASCTRLYHQLSEHFSALDRRLSARSDMLRSKRRLLEARTSRGLDFLRRRELSIDDSVSLAVSHVHSLSSGPLEVTTCSNASDLVAGLNSLCLKMDSSAFLAFVVSRRKEVDALRAEMPSALKCCIDPAKFVMDAISEVFPVDKRAVKSPSDMAWACVVVLEAVVPALADPDTEIGAARPLVPRAARERARGIAMEWKEEVEKKGGVESAKPPDAHAFLQHVATFAVAEKEDRKLYRKIVVSFSWRRQMPRLALMLGLEDEMDDIIEELITKGQHLDAVNFACESGLQDKFPPVPLLKSYLEDSKKTSSTSDNLSTGSGQSGINANKKEQSALRAVIKCIEDRKLEAGFPLEDLRRQLEELEKAKAEKKKATSSSSSGGSTGPANKRIRVSNGGPTPPAKAGRLTSNACVSSSQAATTFVRSPSSHASYGTASSYAYDKPAGHGLYCSQSPVAIREPYAYPIEQVVSVGFGMSYPTPPMSYPAYGGYNNGLGGYGNGMAPVLHQAYYR